MRDDKQILEDRLNLFVKDEWIELKAELENLYTSYEKIHDIENEKQLHFRQGQLSTLGMIINLEESTKLALEQIATEDMSSEDYL